MEKTTVKSEPGATAGESPSNADQAQAASSSATPRVGVTATSLESNALSSVRATTSSLSRDEKLTELLTNFLGSNENIGVRNLLSLAEIKSSVTQSTRGEKPLLIKNFLSSNITVHYGRSADEDLQIGENTKIVFSKKAKKTDVCDYTCDIWSAANSRILIHLIQSGASTRVLLEYADYSAMIADFLSIYINRGVFLLDEHHRYRVANESHKWNKICSHDERQFLKHSTVS